MHYSLWLDELEVLIGGKESNELWHLDDLDVSSSVDIEVSPSLLEVGSEVSSEITTANSLMGAKNLRGGSLGSEFIHPEASGWLSVFVLLFESVVLDHRSHEDIIVVTSESWGGSS